MRLGCILELIRVLFASLRAYKVRKHSHNWLKTHLEPFKCIYIAFWYYLECYLRLYALTKWANVVIIDWKHIYNYSNAFRLRSGTNWRVICIVTHLQSAQTLLSLIKHTFRTIQMRLGCVLVLIGVLFASLRAYNVCKHSHNWLKTHLEKFKCV